MHFMVKNSMVNKGSFPLEKYLDAYRQWGGFLTYWWKNMERNHIYSPDILTKKFDPSVHSYLADWKIICEAMRNSFNHIPFPDRALVKHVDVIMQALEAYIACYIEWVQDIEDINCNGNPASLPHQTMSESYRSDSGGLIESKRSTMAHDLMNIAHTFVQQELYEYVESISNAIQKWIVDISSINRQNRWNLQLIALSHAILVRCWNQNLVQFHKNLEFLLADDHFPSGKFRQTLSECTEAAEESKTSQLEAITDLPEQSQKYLKSYITWASTYFVFMSRVTELPFLLFEEMKTMLHAHPLVTVQREENGTGLSPEKWLKYVQKISEDIIKESKFFAALPSVTNALTEYIQATNAVQQYIYHTGENPKMSSHMQQ